MLHPSTKKLIDRLSEMTRKQKVAWTQGEDGQLYHDTEGYRVVLLPEPHAVHVTDALGRPIETVAPEDFQVEVDADGRPYTTFISELYKEADRHARGAETAIDALMRGLDLDGDGIPDHLQDGPGQPMRPEAAAALAAAATGAAIVSAPDAEALDEALPEDAGDETVGLDGVMPGMATPAPVSADELEMTEAVASMADEVNGAIIPDELVETGEDVMGNDVADFDTPAVTDEDIHPSDVHGTPIELSQTAETVAEPESIAPTDEPAQPTAPTVTPSIGGGFFGTSMNDLNRYRTPTPQPTPEPEPELAAPEPEASQPEPSAWTPPTPSLSPEETMQEPEAPNAQEAGPAAWAEATTPEPQETEDEPSAKMRPFSLSGLSAGYGLGAANPNEPAAELPTPEFEAEPDIEPLVQEPARSRMLIDGTEDLPEADVAQAMQEEKFSFGSDYEDMPPPPEDSKPMFEPAAAAPEPEFEPAPEPTREPAPVTAQEEPAEEETAKPAKPPSRFNPWN